MQKVIYRYAFPAKVPVEEVEASIVLSVFAVESLHGETETRLREAHYFDAKLRKCVVDATTSVGRDFNKIFLGFLMREFGADGFEVEQLENDEARECVAA
jgi:hypothetical protein